MRSDLTKYQRSLMEKCAELADIADEIAAMVGGYPEGASRTAVEFASQAARQASGTCRYAARQCLGYLEAVDDDEIPVERRAAIRSMNRP